MRKAGTFAEGSVDDYITNSYSNEESKDLDLFDNIDRTFSGLNIELSKKNPFWY